MTLEHAGKGRKEALLPFTRMKSFFMLTDPLEGTCLVGELSPRTAYSNDFLLIDLEVGCPPSKKKKKKHAVWSQALVCKGFCFSINTFC